MNFFNYTGVACGLMMMTLASLVLTIFVTVFSGCTSAAVKYAEAANPRCVVTPLEQRGDWAKVLVECPGEKPTERTYGK